MPPDSRSKVSRGKAWAVKSTYTLVHTRQGNPHVNAFLERVVVRRTDPEEEVVLNRHAGGMKTDNRIKVGVDTELCVCCRAEFNSVGVDVDSVERLGRVVGTNGGSGEVHSFIMIIDGLEGLEPFGKGGDSLVGWSAVEDFLVDWRHGKSKEMESNERGGQLNGD